MAITLRSDGTRLTHPQLDGNFADLDTRVHAVAQGGTGASTAAAARAALEVIDPVVMGTIQEGPTSGATYYVSPYGQQTGANVDVAVRSLIPVAGILYGFYVKVNSNTADYSLTATIRKNNVATAMGATVPAGNTALQSDLVDTVSVAVGDLISLSLVAGVGTTGELTGLSWGFRIKGS